MEEWAEEALGVLFQTRWSGEGLSDEMTLSEDAEVCCMRMPLCSIPTTPFGALLRCSVAHCTDFIFRSLLRLHVACLLIMWFNIGKNADAGWSFQYVPPFRI